MDSAATSHAARADLWLRLLGRFELTSGGNVLSVRPSGERLLAYLAVRLEPVSRQDAAAALWPDCTDARGSANLRSVLWRLPGRQQSRVVTCQAGNIALRPGVCIDIHKISGRLTHCSGAGEEIGIAMLRQDVLPGWPEHWLVATRERFRQIRLRALEAICDQHRAAGRLDSALAAALAAVACDPLRESAHRRLALIHISEGNFAEALRQYQIYRKMARSELGLLPSPHFRKLMSPLLGCPADDPTA